MTKDDNPVVANEPSTTAANRVGLYSSNLAAVTMVVTFGLAEKTAANDAGRYMQVFGYELRRMGEPGNSLGNVAVRLRAMQIGLPNESLLDGMAGAWLAMPRDQTRFEITLQLGVLVKILSARLRG